MKPLVEGLEKTYRGKVEFRRLNADGSDPAVSALGDQLGVQYVPAFYFVNSDGSIAKSAVGEMTVEELTTAITSLK